MTFLVISHAVHIKDKEGLYAYGPLVREMNLWLYHVSNVVIVAPQQKAGRDAIFSKYSHSRISFNQIPSISLTSISEIAKTLIYIPVIVFTIFEAMRKANHIHLRCPGNIGLIGCLVQILFPSKKKTAKYAGNWDPNAKQPYSYRFQKWILSNTFLTRNMQVLVYGDWPNQTKNIKPFFTASYCESDSVKSNKKLFKHPLKFIFVGSLVVGKRPLYTIQLIENLVKNNVKCSLQFYGDGVEKEMLKAYVTNNKLEHIIIFHGNQDSTIIKRAYQENHFLLLPSKSEGWPKVVAEAMFWGAIPFVTAISCVPWMLDNDNRGVLLTLDLDTDTNKVQTLLAKQEALSQMSTNAMQWSKKYTLDTFEEEIVKLL